MDTGVTVSADPAGDFRLSSSAPSGITYANDRFYVVDDEDDKVYGYGSDGQRDSGSDFDLGISDPQGYHIHQRPASMWLMTGMIRSMGT